MRFKNGDKKEISLKIASDHSEVSIKVKAGEEIDINEEVNKKIGLAEINKIELSSKKIEAQQDEI